MLRAILFVAVAFFVAADDDNSYRPVPVLPDTFSADVVVTSSMLPMKIPSKLYYDYPNNIQRIDSTMMGITQTNIQKFDTSEQWVYASYFGQTSCKHCFLQPPMYPYYIPPLSTYKGEEKINGKQAAEWEAPLSGFGLDYKLFVVDNSTLIRVELETNSVAGVSYKITMDFSNVVPGPQPSTLFIPPSSCSKTVVCQAAMNLVVVLDGSGSITPSDFASALTFINNLASGFDLGPSYTNVGVVQFSSSVQVPLSLSGDMNAIRTAVNGIQQLGSGTNLGLGISQATSMLKNAARQPSKPSSNVIVIITDGASNEGGAPSVAANAALQAGYSIFAIGVGSQIDVVQLKSVISSPVDLHLFTTKGFSALGEVLKSVTATTCQETTCSLDSSSSSPSLSAFPFQTVNGDTVYDSEENSAASGVIGIFAGAFLLALIALVAVIALQQYRRRRYVPFSALEMHSMQ